MEFQRDESDVSWSWSSISCLPPPGNPVKWLSRSFACLDDWCRIGEYEVVLDVPIRPTALQLHHLLPSRAEDEVSLQLRRTIRISECLDDGHTDFRVSLPDFKELLCQIFVPVQMYTPKLLDIKAHLPEEIYVQLDGLACASPNEREVHIYTDGSYTRRMPDLASWAFVVFFDEGTMYPCHCEFAKVALDSLASGWAGHTTASAKAGEEMALVRAIEWCLAYDRPIWYHFHFDAQSVGFSAAGRFGFQADDIPQKILRGLAQALEVHSDRRVMWHYVKAHQGNLGNELADALAKLALKTDISSPERPRPEYANYCFGKRAPIEHFWWIFHELRGTENLPKVFDGTIYSHAMSKASSQESRLPAALSQPFPENRLREKMIRLSVMTYNVRTLAPRKGSHKVGYLREQLADEGFHIAFLQETRIKTSNLIVSETHFRVTSAAVKGLGGTEIWISRKDVHTGRILCDKQSIKVLYQSPEFLLVRAIIQGTTQLLFSAHAPHTSSPAGVTHEFWDVFREQMLRWTAECPSFIGGIDANAHFEHPAEPHIGNYGLEAKGNLAADLFRDMLMQINAFLPSTHSWCHTGQTETWVSSANGQRSRCDYLVVPLGWMSGQLRTSLTMQVDSGNQGEDHLPLAGSFRVLCSKMQAVKIKPEFDRDQIHRTDRLKVQQAFADPPMIPWNVDVDEHATKLSDWVVERLMSAFPKPEARARKSYISPATWKYRQTRLDERSSFREEKSMMAKLTLYAAYQAWHKDKPLNALLTIGKAIAKCMHLCVKGRKLAQMGKVLSKHLRDDRTASLTEIAASTANMSTKDLYAALRRIGIQSRRKPSGIQPLPLVRDSEGNPLSTFRDLANRWREHFAEQEDGVSILPQQFLDDTAEKRGLPVVVPNWEHLPTKIEIEMAFRSTRSHKAYFDDFVPGDLLARIPEVMAQAYYPLMLKQVMFQREALLHKGGRLIPSFKKGDPSICSNYRSLFVSSVVGKALHKVYRQELSQTLENNRLSLQIGGLKGHSITQASHCLHLLQRIALQRNESLAIIFVDIQNAFYRLLRKHITVTPDDNRTVRELFAGLGLPAQAYNEFQECMNQPPALESAGVSPFLRTLFGEFFTDTWYKIEGAEHWTKTRRGSRPGDSFADACFAFALSKILRDIDADLVAEFPFISIEWSGHHDPFERHERHQLGPLLPIWADDISLAVRHPCPQTLLREAPRIASLLLHRLATAGLKPNMKKGKTEMILDLRGPRSLPARRALVATGYQLPLETDLIEDPLHITHAYCHLGTTIDSKGRFSRDFRQKMAVAHDVITRYKAQLFSNRGLDLKRKMQLFDALVIKAITFNSALWQPQTPKQWAQVQAGFLRLYRRICMCHFGPGAKEWSASKIHAKLEVPQAGVILRAARLRYFSQLVRLGQAHTWGLIQTEQKWYGQICFDLEWLSRQCPEDEVPGGGLEDWPKLYDRLHSHQGQWKRMIRKAVKRDIAYHRRKFEWEEWHAWIHDYLTQAGALPVRTCEQPEKMHFCLLCKRQFSSAAAQAVHSFKMHDRRQAARYFVTGRQCLHCLKHYNSHVYLVNHVKRSTACLEYYQNEPILIDPEPGVNSRVADRLQQSTIDPFLQAEGPRLPKDANSIADPHLFGEKTKLWDAWSDALQTSMSAARELCSLLRQATCVTFLTPNEILAEYQRWKQMILRDNEELTLRQLHELACFASNFGFAWFVQAPIVEDEKMLKANLFFDREAASNAPFAFVRYKLPQYRPVLFAHFFSGRRRNDDFQMCLDALGMQAISIDIIYHAEAGDLCNPATFDLFRRAIEQGIVCGFLAGPPCETWSRARGKQLASGEHGPRVVRSNESPFGRRCLTLREDVQVSFGSRLLGVTMRLFCVALVNGATAIVEHPAPDEQRPDEVAIWRTALIRTLLRFPRCSQQRVLQGHYGARSAKPTCLLLANCDESAEQILLSARSTALPQEVSIGKTNEGGWKTAILKEYPAGFCKALAAVAAVSQPAEPKSDPIPTWFMEKIEPLLACFNEEAEMGPDFGNQQRTHE